MDYERVIGLEVHCELKTNSKMFSASPVTFGEDPNTMINEVDMGMTGTLPCLNKRGVEFAIRVCHALHMEIDELLCFDRKNYYYSDLPKGFQITQDKRPIGRNGYLMIEVDGEEKRIDIERLHMEEDTAKQLHLTDYSLIDYNRAGIPLIEIVTKPCIRSGKEASAYLEALRQVFLYTEVSDAKLEEGSMRCDVNVSIRPFGQEAFGTRTEIKNLNSISNVQKAIDYEAGRQQEVIESGGEVLQETRRYDEVEKVTTVMRSKGDAVDYKYYTEPNILPIRLDHAWVEQIKDELPMMAGEREKHYEEEYGIPKVDAKILVSTKSMSDYFNEVIKYTKNYKNASNWLLGDVLAFLNKNNQSYDDIELNTKDQIKILLEEKEIILRDITIKREESGRFLVNLYTSVCNSVDGSACGVKKIAKVLEKVLKDKMIIQKQKCALRENDDTCVFTFVSEDLYSLQVGLAKSKKYGSII